MPAFPIRERLLPYRILARLLYAPEDACTWLENAGPGLVRVSTGDAARALRMKNSNLWEALYWLEENRLVEAVRKEKKRGTALIELRPPLHLTEEHYG